MTKQYNNRAHSSTTLTPIQASLKTIEGFVYKMLLDKGNKITPKFQINDRGRTIDIMKTFSKGDTTNWSYILYKITEIVYDKIPLYETNNSPER